MDKRDQSNNLGPLLIILVILLVSLAAHYAREGRWMDLLSKIGWVREETLVLQERAIPPRVISDFPTELLAIVRDTEVVDSASYRSEDGTKLILRTSFLTKASPSDLFAAYLSFFSENGYKVSEARAGQLSAKIEANNSSREVSVVIKTKGSTVNEVEISVERIVIK